MKEGVFIWYNMHKFILGFRTYQYELQVGISFVREQQDKNTLLI